MFKRFWNWLKSLFGKKPALVATSAKGMTFLKPPMGPAIYRSGSRKRIAKAGYEREKRIGFGTFTRMKAIR